ncbi:MAG: hypothetical protein O2944_10235 [Proteobacteria bacterium]|nr:hypothetical protein [Pseudomonadota bacterium]
MKLQTRVIEKKMGITHADFRRLLAVALGGNAVEAGGSFSYTPAPGKTLRLGLSPEGVRKIALLEMPMTRVTLTFEGYSDAEHNAAMALFDRAFQRGGG